MLLPVSELLPHPFTRQPGSGSRQPKDRFTLAQVLAIIPTTKRSQVELLVRTGKITPAWPSAGTGHDRAFDGMNLFEIAIATELIALGFVGRRLTQYFRIIINEILDERASRDANYLLLKSTPAGPIPVSNRLISAADLESNVGLWGAVVVLNVRAIVMSLRIAVENFAARQETN